MPPVAPPRDVNGKFTAINPLTAEARIRAQQRRDASDRIADTADSLFDSFLKVFMRVGDNNSESIAAGAGEGPLCFIAESLIRKKYLLGRYDRCTKTRHYYFQQRNEGVKKQSQLPTITVRISRNSKEQKIQKPIFKKCRLPRLTARSQELKDVWQWIDSGIDNDLLKTTERNTAFGVVQNAKSIYADVRAEIGYRVGKAGASNSPANQGEQSLTGGIRVHNREAAVERRADVDINNESERDVIDLCNDEEPLLSPPPNSEEERISFQFKRMIDAAKDDKLFFLMCKAVDFNDDNIVQICSAASVFLNELKDQEKHVLGMLEEVLRYSIGVRFGRRNQEVDKDLESRVRINLDLLRASRRFLGKAAYEHTSWESLRNKSGPNIQSSSVRVTEDTCPGGILDPTSSTTPGNSTLSQGNDNVPRLGNPLSPERSRAASLSLQRTGAPGNIIPPAGSVFNVQSVQAAGNSNPPVAPASGEGSSMVGATAGNNRILAAPNASHRLHVEPSRPDPPNFENTPLQRPDPPNFENTPLQGMPCARNVESGQAQNANNINVSPPAQRLSLHSGPFPTSNEAITYDTTAVLNRETVPESAVPVERGRNESPLYSRGNERASGWSTTAIGEGNGGVSTLDRFLSSGFAAAQVPSTSNQLNNRVIQSHSFMGDGGGATLWNELTSHQVRTEANQVPHDPQQSTEAASVVRDDTYLCLQRASGPLENRASGTRSIEEQVQSRMQSFRRD